MKQLLRLFAALALTFMLTLPAFAGEITTMRTGEMSTPRSGDMSTTVTATDLVVKTALNLYHSMLAVF